MSRNIDSYVTFQILKELLYETANNNFIDKKFSDACVDIANNRLSTWISLIPTADINENKNDKCEKMSNKEWVDFLSEQFNVSRTSAREMLHCLMKYKAADNFKKQFNQKSPE